MVEEYAILLLLPYLIHRCFVFIKIELGNAHESILKNVILSTNIRFNIIASDSYS